jgi:uncharacterized membrane-anchored protein
MLKVIALVAGIAVLAGANWTIFARERHLAEGRVVLLELAPVDPRSLMQGDYMALRFRIAGAVPRERNGRFIAKLDVRGVAQYARGDDGARLAADEVLMRYRLRNGEVRFATNAFFFQEGHARYYERAQFGEFRVSPSGELLLTAMRGANLETLGPPAGR